MALICVNGARECCGCMQCQDEIEVKYCERCGDELDEDYYIVDDEYLCEDCLKTMFKARW